MGSFPSIPKIKIVACLFASIPVCFLTERLTTALKESYT